MNTKNLVHNLESIKIKLFVTTDDKKPTENVVGL